MINITIRTDKDTKETAENIYRELGLDLNTAINMFLRATIRENGILFEMKLHQPNKTTIEAIEEGRRIAYDENVKGYKNMEDFRKMLD